MICFNLVDAALYGLLGLVVVVVVALSWRWWQGR